MLNLRRPIDPGKAAAGLSLGDPVAKLSQTRCREKRTLGDSLELVDFGPVRVWARGGVIDQIGVRGEYSGYVRRTTIGIGSSIQEVIDAIGPVVEDDEDNLVVLRVPGLCFETETWRGDPGRRTIDENLNAKLTEIFVFHVQDS